MKYIDVREELPGKRVVFPVGVDKGRVVVVKKIVPWCEGKDQVFYQKGKVSIIIKHGTEIEIRE